MDYRSFYEQILAYMRVVCCRRHRASDQACAENGVDVFILYEASCEYQFFDLLVELNKRLPGS